MILILTLSNKLRYLPDALRSVRAQTRRDYRHIVHLDDGRWGDGVYSPAAFFNAHAIAAGPDDYVAWLSDDDRWEATYLETLAGYLDEHPDVGACYGGLHVVLSDPDRDVEVPHRDIPAELTFDAKERPSCRIDGGQVLIRRSVLDRLGQPWVPEVMENCHYVDGTFLNRVVDVTPIVPVVGSWVVTNRITPLSSHWRLVNGAAQFLSGAPVEELRR